MIREGRGFSGHERNCAFLNLAGQDQRFANVSSATSLDFDDDGRSVASIDWDGDGDLDIWVTNRTGPAVRYLRNDTPSTHTSLTFDLRGTTANRNAVGARVELYQGKNGATRRIKSVRAGHGHLAQSSLHVAFGLGTAGPASHVIVKWPGGSAEKFPLPATGTQFQLVQGSGVASPVAPRPAVPVLTPSSVTPPEESDAGRIVLLRPAPVPDLLVTTASGETTALAPISSSPAKPLLINLWATWCAPCLKEMAEWTSAQDRLKAAGLDIVSISVDDQTDPAARLAAVTATLAKIGYPFRTAFPDENLIARLESLQRSFIGRQSALPVPSSFLLDSRGRLAVVYRGPVAVDQLLADLTLLDQPLDKIVTGAVPFPGRWLGQPKPTEARSVAIKFLNRGLIGEAETYVRRLSAWQSAHPGVFSAQERSDLQNYLGAVLYDQNKFQEALTAWNEYIQQVPGDRATLVDMARAWTALKQPVEAAATLRQALRMKRDDVDLLAQLGRSLMAAGDPSGFREAASLFREAMALQPSRVLRFELAQALGLSGRCQEAIAELRAILAASPGWPPATNNLAWLLATGPDASLRDGPEAVRLATTVRNPEIIFTLGTLSAAYAEAGQFDNALQTIREAIAIEQARPSSEYLKDFQTMQASYEARQPHRDPRLAGGQGS